VVRVLNQSCGADRTPAALTEARRGRVIPSAWDSVSRAVRGSSTPYQFPPDAQPSLPPPSFRLRIRACLAGGFFLSQAWCQVERDDEGVPAGRCRNFTQLQPLEVDRSRRSSHPYDAHGVTSTTVVVESRFTAALQPFGDDGDVAQTSGDSRDPPAHLQPWLLAEQGR
jgi:hypothetical protein